MHLEIPDSGLCRAAADLLAATSSPALVGHCYRTFGFGTALVAGRGTSYDREVLFVASALHDLGLTPAHRDAEAAGFEQIGAAAASDVLRQHGGTERRAALAADAVALHLELSTADDPRPEVAAVHLGATVDVLGLRVDDLPAGTLDALLEEWPRDGFPAELQLAMRYEADKRPGSTAAAYVREIGFLDLIAAAPLPG